MRYVLAIFASLACACGTSGDASCSDAWNGADARNYKGEAPADTCNICSPDCAFGPWGYWGVSTDDPFAKRELGEDVSCSLRWRDLERDALASEVCP